MSAESDELLRLLREIVVGLEEVRREERHHMSMLDRAIGRVKAIETLFRAFDRVTELSSTAHSRRPPSCSQPQALTTTCASVRLVLVEDLSSYSLPRRPRLCCRPGDDGLACRGREPPPRCANVGRTFSPLSASGQPMQYWQQVVYDRRWRLGKVSFSL
jgi:hypothetical protein